MRQSIRIPWLLIFESCYLLYRQLYKRIISILIVLLVLGLSVALAGTYFLSENLVESQALQFAKVAAKTLNEARTLYSANVVHRLQHLDTVRVGAEYHTVTGGIPNPATYTIELGETLSDPSDGMLFRLYSNYPFPNRKFTGGPHDAFEEEALAYLMAHPNDSFYRTEEFGGGMSFRYTEPVLMEASCVECHNRLPNSPKQDWSIGDVRGIVEITQPLDGIMLITQDGLMTIYGVLLGIVVLTSSGLALVIVRLRTINQDLQIKVTNRTLELQRLASMDGLTQLANRRLFDETLEKEWMRSRRQCLPLSLIMCDVDHFKQYNDTYGHQAGDSCLQLVASVLQASAKRSGELAARYGGEEFAVILPNVDTDEAVHLAHQIRMSIHNLNILHAASATQPYVTLSMGIACMRPNAQNSSTALIKAADTALYQAKDEGRDRAVVAAPSSGAFVP